MVVFGIGSVVVVIGVVVSGGMIDDIVVSKFIMLSFSLLDTFLSKLPFFISS